MNKRLINTFCKIVKIDSPTGFEKPFALHIYKMLKLFASGIRMDRLGNIYARIKGEGEPLFFSAHMDTVEPGRGIRPVVKNAYITSDGTTILGGDNKIAIACILETLRTLKEKKLRHRPLEIMFTVSEEINNNGALNFNYSLLHAKKGYCFDRSAPVGTIVTASPYYERFDLTIVGKEAHASVPRSAVNVVLVFNELLNSIKLGIIDKDTIVNVGVVKAGQVRNTIPGEMFVAGEIRSFVEEKLLKTKHALLAKIKAVTSKTGSKAKIDFVRENGGYKLTGKLSKNFIDETEEAIKRTNIKPHKEVAWGVSDANIFNEKGLICLNLGDGGEFAHSRRERVKISEMEKLLLLMIELVKQ